MTLCQHCTQLAGVVCRQYNRTPPANTFAEKCRHFERLEDLTEVQACDDCPRHDEDQHGEWCLYSIEKEFTNFKPIRGDQFKCPLM